MALIYSHQEEKLKRNKEKWKNKIEKINTSSFPSITSLPNKEILTDLLAKEAIQLTRASLKERVKYLATTNLTLKIGDSLIETNP